MRYILYGLQRALEPIDELNLGCEGTSWIISSLLEKNEVPHILMSGSISHTNGRVVVPHFWIELDQWIIDFRIRMWFGRNNQGLPHGCFKVNQAREKGFVYRGEKAINHHLSWCDAVLLSDSLIYEIDNSRLFEQVVEQLGSHGNRQGALW